VLHDYLFCYKTYALLPLLNVRGGRQQILRRNKRRRASNSGVSSIWREMTTQHRLSQASGRGAWQQQRRRACLQRKQPSRARGDTLIRALSACGVASALPWAWQARHLALRVA